LTYLMTIINGLVKFLLIFSNPVFLKMGMRQGRMQRGGGAPKGPKISRFLFYFPIIF
jgi:hypothetical protein